MFGPFVVGMMARPHAGKKRRGKLAAGNKANNEGIGQAMLWLASGPTMEPLYQGDPVLAVAAVDEATAVAALEAIDIAFEPLPFVIDPLESLRPGGPNARGDNNVWLPPGKSGELDRIGKLKWTEADFAAAGPKRLPWGKTPAAWSFGDVEAGLKQAALVLDETFVTANVSHQALEPRATLAWWENGKLHLVAGTQSTMAFAA